MPSLTRRHPSATLNLEYKLNVLVYAIGDLHLSPSVSNKRMKWIGEDIAWAAPDLVVQIGDLFSFDSLCKYEPNESYAGKLKPVYVQDIAAGRKGLELMNEWGAAKFKKHVTLGNHDDRIESFADRVPEVFGLMQEHFYGALTDNGWSWSAYKEIVKFEGVQFTHIPIGTLGKVYGGKTAEQRAAADSLGDLVVGHRHNRLIVSAPKLGNNEIVTVINLGCALPEGHIEKYALHTLTGWSYGVWRLCLKKGKIKGFEFKTMGELEAAYG